MSRYWDISNTYSQPSIEEMRNRVRKGIARAAGKGKLYEPVEKLAVGHARRLPQIE